MIFWIVFATIICFGYVLLFGAPYLPTLKKQKIEALDLLDLKPGQLLLELGCGDGRVLNEAAKRGVKSIGYELNPIMFVITKISTLKNRKYVSVKFANYWTEKWPKADGIYTFSINKFMGRLDKKIIESDLKPGLKVVSYAHKIPGKIHVKTKNALFLYKY